MLLFGLQRALARQVADLPEPHQLNIASDTFLDE